MDWQKVFFWRKSTPYIILDKYAKHNQRAGDRLVIKHLQEEGADLSLERETLHYLYLPSEDAAIQACHELRAEGYDVEQRKTSNGDQDPPNPWLVLAKIEAAVDADRVQRVTLRFTELAGRYGGEYDGWEAAAKP